MGGNCISRGVRKLSPYVYTEIFKRCASKVKDYAVIQITPDPFDPYNVLFRIVEPLYFKQYNVPTGTWGDTGEVKVVLVRLDDDLIMVEFNELAEIIQRKSAC